MEKKPWYFNVLDLQDDGQFHLSSPEVFMCFHFPSLSLLMSLQGHFHSQGLFQLGDDCVLNFQPLPF